MSRLGAARETSRTCTAEAVSTSWIACERRVISMVTNDGKSR
jgi:hypothetical protein